MKGRAAAIPNQGILIDTLALQEAKASSEIENIVTTQTSCFGPASFRGKPLVRRCEGSRTLCEALREGFVQQRRLGGLLTNNMFVAMFQMLKRTDENVPQHTRHCAEERPDGGWSMSPRSEGDAVRRHMAALERFINEDDASDLDRW